MAETIISTPRAPRMRVRVGVRLDQFNADLAKVTRIIVLAGAAILLIAPLSGYWLAGRATRPLAEMFQTAAGLHPDNMMERLPVRQTGDELDRLSVTINGLLDRLADYLHRKRDFIANAAHELRSPLAAIQTSVDVALNSERSITEYQDLLGDVRSECGDLVALVNQLLFLAESDAGNLEPGGETVRLDRIVSQSIEMFRGHAEQRGIDLRFTHLAEVAVVGSASHFRQIVNNLIDNALKFTQAGGATFVDLRIAPSSGEVVLEVADTGAGIAPADLPRVFDRFYRADKSRRRDEAVSSNGLGLSICQSIVHAYRGSILVDSTQGKGASFRVVLPGDLIVSPRSAIGGGDERVSA
jgi:signal transduction histidine kinase